MPDRSPLLSTALRVLCGTVDRETLLKLDGRHLSLGLICTWGVGMGRYWDHPNAHLLQIAGLGSVLYVFALATLLWLVIWPLRPREWSWFRLLTYVTLTSPPAALYAIPVEFWLDKPTARGVNAWFLAIVALWRVILLIVYLRRVARLNAFAVAAGALLPLMGVTFILTVLNLERAVFDIMGGIREGTPHDSAYMILVIITWLSFLGIWPVLIVYLTCIGFAWKKPRNDAPPEFRGQAPEDPPTR
jgi:hypothetical protein